LNRPFSIPFNGTLKIKAMHAPRTKGIKMSRTFFKNAPILPSFKKPAVIRMMIKAIQRIFRTFSLLRKFSFIGFSSPLLLKDTPKLISVYMKFPVLKTNSGFARLK